MESPAKHPWLFIRGSRWYLRAKVPADLVSAVGRIEIKKSLGTSDRREAQRIIHREAMAVQAYFDSLRMKDRSPPSKREAVESLTTERIESLAAEWFSLRRQSLNTQPALWMDDRERREALASVEEELSAMHADAAQFRSFFLKQAATHLTNAGFEPDRNGVITGHLVDLLYRGECEALRQRAAELKHEFCYQVRDPVLKKRVSSAAASEQSRSDLANPKIGLGHTLDQVLSLYDQDPNRRGIIEKTRQEDRRVFEIMREVFGKDTRITDVTRADCRDFKSLILRLPKNAQQRCPGLSAKRAAEQGDRAGLERLSPKGANKYLHKLSAIFKFAEIEGMISTSPARNIAIKGAPHSAEDRLPFSSYQLRLIFNSQEMRGNFVKRFQIGKAGHFWVPVLSLYMGLRLGEACQLERSDFNVVENVSLLRIAGDNEPGGKRVKTEAGKRSIPIHPMIIKLGLLSFIENVSNKGDMRLFPEIKRGKDSYFSPYSKAFSRFLIKTGSHSSKTTFHSLRHNFRDALRAAEVHNDIADRLGGWKGGGDSTGNKYGSGGGYKPHILREYISRVRYDELDFNSLEVSDNT